MRDLLTEPFWRADDLGKALPASPHGVSVSLPLWEHVIRYEENDPAIIGKFESGYPRFFLPPLVEQLNALARGECGADGEGALVFPSEQVAQRALDFVAARGVSGARKHAWKLGTCIVTVAESDFAVLKLYWRFAGEIVSTRFAEAILGNTNICAWRDEAADHGIKARLARASDVAAEHVFLYQSGMAAVFAVHRMVRSLKPGLATVQLDFPYVDVLKVQEEFGNPVQFFPVADEKARAAVADLLAHGEVGAIFCEMPSNPLLRAVSLKELANKGALLVVDDTVVTNVNINALAYADLTTTSLTKAFSGHGDVMAGAVTLNPRSPFYTAMREWMLQDAAQPNQGLFQRDAIVLEKNSRDYPKRVRRMSHNAQALVNWLKEQPEIAQVFYPSEDVGGGLEDVLRPGAGRGPLFSIVFKDAAHAPIFYDALEVCKGPSLGTNFTLACPYTLLAHYQELDWAATCGVSASLIRISAGLEEKADLLARFARAFGRLP